MSSESAKRKKMDAPTSTPTNTGDGDHRKRRRNRTTQACLHCHTSKRMCDRKRPCGRCTQLGITGLCVYEIDDPSQRIEDAGDKIHLQKRVAELEGVIRELKNKPHPRSAQQPSNLSQGQQGQGQTLDTPATSPRPAENSSRNPPTKEGNVSSQSPSPKTDETTAAPHSTPKKPLLREGPLAPLPFEELPGPSTPFIDPFNVDVASCLSSSGLDTPNIASVVMTSVPAFSSTSESSTDETMTSLLSYLTNGDIQIDAPLANLFDSTLHDITRDKDSRNACMFGHQTPLGECSCLTEAANYYAVLELSLRLRRAADILSRYPLHSEGSACLLKQRITDLDIFTSTTLEGVNTPGMSGFRQAQPSCVGHHPCSDCTPPEAGWPGASVAFSVSAGVHPGPSSFVTSPCNSLISWTPQQLWNTSTSSVPISWANTGSHYPTTDTICSCGYCTT